jgi:hypothetical protein
MITTYTVGEVYNEADFKGSILVSPRKDGSSTILTRDDVLTMFQTVFPTMDYESFVSSQPILRVELDSRFIALGPDCFRQTIVSEVIFQKDTQMADLGTRAFDSCHFLEFVDLSLTKVTEIPTSTFQGAGSYLPSTLCFHVKLPSTTLTRMGDSSFAYSKLQWIHVPEGVLSLGPSAFASCTFLESVSLPSTLLGSSSSVESLVVTSSSAFQGCNKIRTVTCTSGMVNSFPTFSDNLFVYNTTEDQIQNNDPIGYVRKEKATDALLHISDQQPPGTRVLFPFTDMVSNNRFDNHRTKYVTSLEHVIVFFVPKCRAFHTLDGKNHALATDDGEVLYGIIKPSILDSYNHPRFNVIETDRRRWYGEWYELPITNLSYDQSEQRWKDYWEAEKTYNSAIESARETAGYIEEEDTTLTYGITKPNILADMNHPRNNKSMILLDGNDGVQFYGHFFKYPPSLEEYQRSIEREKDYWIADAKYTQDMEEARSKDESPIEDKENEKEKEKTDDLSFLLVLSIVVGIVAIAAMIVFGVGRYVAARQKKLDTP